MMLPWTFIYIILHNTIFTYISLKIVSYEKRKVAHMNVTQLTFTCSNSVTEVLEKGVKYDQS